jgi:hypothetical protein
MTRPVDAIAGLAAHGVAEIGLDKSAYVDDALEMAEQTEV